METKVTLDAKFGLFDEYWSPRIVGEVNECHVKIAKISGEFVWHHHESEDELFLVVKGRLTMRFRDGEQHLDPGEMIVIPRGVEHLPIADEETWIMLVEPKSTVNTGSAPGERTVLEPPAI